MNTMLGLPRAFPQESELSQHNKGGEGAAEFAATDPNEGSPSIYVFSKPFIHATSSSSSYSSSASASSSSSYSFSSSSSLDLQPNNASDLLFLRAYGLHDRCIGKPYCEQEGNDVMQTNRSGAGGGSPEGGKPSDAIDPEFLHKIRKSLMTFAFLLSSTVILFKNAKDSNWFRFLEYEAFFFFFFFCFLLLRFYKNVFFFFFFLATFLIISTIRLFFLPCKRCRRY